MSNEMKKQGNKGNVYAPGVIDTKLGYPMAYRLRVLYERKMKEDWGSIQKIRMKRFSRFIGKVFKIDVPKIKLMKGRKMERKYKVQGINGVTEVDKGKCKIWLRKEMVKSGDGEKVYMVLLHELRHCWQATNYLKYYGEKEDTPALQALREADAQAFAELIMYYLFEYIAPFTELSGTDRGQIEYEKNEIRTELWEQIKRYYRFHGGLKSRKEVRRIDRETYKNVK